MAPKSRTAPAPEPACPPERYADEGMVVQWLPTAGVGERPVPAMVTAIGLNAIDVMTHHPSLVNAMPYSGVHHVDDVRLADAEGVWRHIPLNLAMLKMAIDMGVLEWDGVKSRYVPAKKSAVKADPPSDPVAAAGTAAGTAAGAGSSVRVPAA